MIQYRVMDETHTVPSCLHGGVASLCTTPPAYIETISTIPPGSVALCLQRFAARYGACGMLAVDGDMVVGKIRAYPQIVLDYITYPCIQAELPARELLRLDINTLPEKDEYPVLHLYCIQVAQQYRGRKVAAGMLDALIEWARDNGWRELRARAVSHIPPMLDWCGQLSRDALERRGFTVISREYSDGLLGGIVSARRGDHGQQELARWANYTHISDEDAATVYKMMLTL